MKQNVLSKIIRSVLWRTGIGRKTAEWFWHNRSEGAGFEPLRYREENVFDELPTYFDSPEYSAFIKADNKHNTRQAEYVVAIDNVLLEPERLLGIRAGREVVEQTVVYKWDRQYPYILPYLLHPRECETLPMAMLYDGSATRNYYHHFVDALSQLTLLPQTTVPKDIPLLITRAMYEMPFFQYLYQRSVLFKGMNWRIVEPGEWLQVNKLYKIQAMQWDTSTWRQMRAIYELPDSRPTRRVFLNRDSRYVGRYLSNESEVEAMLHRHGFETVFAERLSMAEQAQLFQETEYLVALTGAGLIQQFFMNPQYGHVIEVMPANRLMPEYYWQGFKLGMHYYDVVVGGAMAIREGKDYAMNVDTLEAAVVRMLANTSLTATYGRTVMPTIAHSTNV